MDIALLEKIGMTPGEVRVYLALLELGSCSTGAIIDKSHITSSKVYVILQRLEQKGLVSHIVKNNVKCFQVANPKRLLAYMEERKKEVEADMENIKALIPALQARRRRHKELQDATIYQGFRGFQSALEEAIDGLKVGEEFLVFGARGHFGKAFERYIRQFYVRKERAGIRTRLIYNSGFREVKRLYRGLKLTEVRFIDQLTPSTVVVAGNKLLLVSYGDDPRQVLITSKQLAASFAEFFESMWSVAKR